MRDKDAIRTRFSLPGKLALGTAMSMKLTANCALAQA